MLRLENRAYLPHLLNVTVCILLAIVVWNSTAIPKYDQEQLISYTFSFSDYPRFELGITSGLIAGLYNRLDTFDLVSSNAHIRAVATILYLSAAYLLLSTRRGSRQVTLLCMLLLITSRYPFLWLASELFAGAFLMLVLWSVMRDTPFWMTAFFVTLFALSKPDLILSGILVGLYLAYATAGTRSYRWHNVLVLLGFLLLLLLPGLLQDGAGFFQSRGRAVFSMRQHYGALVEPHQMTQQRPDPWVDWGAYFLPVWGESESIPDLIRANPRIYLDFIFLSMAQSLRNFLRSNLLFLIPLWLVCFVRVRHRKMKIVSLLFLSGFIPITLLSFTHVRYIARFYPLLLFMIYLYLAEKRSTVMSKIILAMLVALLCWQTYQLLPLIPAAHWFPD